MRQAIFLLNVHDFLKNIFKFEVLLLYSPIKINLIKNYYK